MKKPTLQEFSEEIRKMNELCKDPQPGLFTWHEFFREHAETLKDMLVQLGY